MKIRSMTVSVLALLLTAAAGASDLPSRSYMGVAPSSAAPGEEFTVQQLGPNGSGAAIGMRQGDKILSINGMEVTDFDSLRRVLAKIRAGDGMEVIVLRDGAELVLSGAAKGRGRETGEGYAVTYSSVEFDQNTMRAIYFYPEKPRADKAALFYIQGYTCGSIDYAAVPEITIQQLLANFAKAGFVVMKVEKPGVGDSIGPDACEDINFTKENNAFKAALAELKQDPSVDAENVFVFGHSLGVLHNAVLASEGLAKGVIGYGGVLKPWYDYMLDLYSEQAVKYFGVDRQTGQQNRNRVQPFLTRWLNTDESWESILGAPELQEVLGGNLLAVSGEQYLGRHNSFFRDLNSYDFKALWRSSKSHVLSLHGDLDIQAINGDWAKDITDLVRAEGNVGADYAYFEGTEHALVKYASLEELRQAMSNGTHRPDNPGERYNSDIAQKALAWVEDVLAS